MINYALITNSEDGESVIFLSQKGLLGLLENPMEHCSVKSFIEKVDDSNNRVYKWDNGEALLLKYEIVVPKPTAIRYCI